MRKLIFPLLYLLLAVPCTGHAACDPNIPADLTGDCHVDFNDFAIMASDWLTPSAAHEWAATYNGPANGEDWPRAIAVDSSNNIYVTGRSSGSGTLLDYSTVKYSPDSNQPVWVARYDGPDNSNDSTRAIVVDSSDNIYVTGVSLGSGTGPDYATIKYSPDSNKAVWVARYNGPGNQFDDALAIAVDSNDNIYVTGASYGSAANADDYATVKYSPDSNQPVWIARYNGLGNSDDYAQAIAIDSNDNIYVTGYSYGFSTNPDYLTIKYSSDYNQPVWVARYNEPPDGAGAATAIAVDSTDNIYVTGTGKTYIKTVKYSSDSNQPVWISKYNLPGSVGGYAEAIAIDSNDNIYVTGFTHLPWPDTDYVTIKYSPDSNQPVWAARYNGPGNDSGTIQAITIDSKDNIYVTGGSTGSGTKRDYLTIKYSPDTNRPVSILRYNRRSPAIAEAIAVDSNDNIYVTGWSEDPDTDRDYLTIKYPPDFACTPQVTGDFDNDCKVDIYDLEIFCRYWLECNLDPPEACWD